MLGPNSRPASPHLHPGKKAWALTRWRWSVSLDLSVQCPWSAHSTVYHVIWFRPLSSKGFQGFWPPIPFLPLEWSSFFPSILSCPLTRLFSQVRLSLTLPDTVHWPHELKYNDPFINLSLLFGCQLFESRNYVFFLSTPPMLGILPA